MNKKFYLAIGVLFLILSLAGATRANQVTNTNDSGAGSLRQAIDDFNNDISGAPGAITFSSLFNVPQTITLNTEIVIAGGGSLTINGPGANLLFITMGGTGRIFNGSGTLTIKGMTLQYGRAAYSQSSTDGQGSAIYFDGSDYGFGVGSLTLDGVAAQNNDGSSIALSSAAVYFDKGTNHRIINSTFSGNRNKFCGAIFARFNNQSGTLTIFNSTISDNSSTTSSGGGICIGNGTVKIRNSTITGNSAGNGGGIDLYGGTLNLGNTIVAGNTAANFPDIYWGGGTVQTATLGNYADTTVQLGANTTITPDAAPTNTSSLTVATSTNFKGKLEGNPATGVVRVTDAHPAGTYIVTVTAFDSGGLATTKTFTLTVTTPATCNPVSFATATDFPAGTGPDGIAVGDFNRDGKQDLAVANAAATNVSILLGDGAGSFGAPNNFEVGGQPASIVVGDFNRDGKQDLATANFSTSDVGVLLGDGTGSFSAAAGSPFASSFNSTAFSIAVGDFNSDSKQDLVVANKDGDNVSILLGNGAGGFGAPNDFGVGTRPTSVVVGDFDGDGKHDLAVVNNASNDLTVLIGNGAGSFSPAAGSPFALNPSSSPFAVAVGHFDAGVTQDLAVVSEFDDKVSVLLGTGTGGFGSATGFTVDDAPRSVVVGDFNGDSMEDLATGNFGGGNVSVLLGNGAGSFGAATNFGVGTDPQAIALGDFNGDGKEDLATSSAGAGGNVWVLLRQCAPTAAPASISGQITTGDGAPVEGVAISLSGTQNRRMITDANGNYHFDNVETNGFYTVTPSRANFGFNPFNRSFSQLGTNTEAIFTATSMGDNENPLDTTEYFVRQQYVDFLSREPDEAGFVFWVNSIESCGADQGCRAVKRIDTSAAFFLSIEFQQTGYLVERTYQAAYGEMPNAPVPLTLGEFKPDTAEIGNGVIVNQIGWQTTLEANKEAFMTEFVQRARFTSVYPTTLSPFEFVDRMFMNAGVVPTNRERMAAVNEFSGAPTIGDATARARALRDVAENSTLQQQEFDRAFVLMEYFGYLRRDPNSAPDTDFSGYNFWLSKLDSFNGSYQNAEMVKAFLVAGEYRQRFPK